MKKIFVAYDIVYYDKNYKTTYAKGNSIIDFYPISNADDLDDLEEKIAETIDIKHMQNVHSVDIFISNFIYL